jgi:hypothetical protein
MNGSAMAAPWHERKHHPRIHPQRPLFPEKFSGMVIGTPCPGVLPCDDQVVNELDTDFNPFTAFFDLEAPLGQGLDNLFEATGIQQAILDPILGIAGR